MSKSKTQFDHNLKKSKRQAKHERQISFLSAHEQQRIYDSYKYDFMKNKNIY